MWVRVPPPVPKQYQHVSDEWRRGPAWVSDGQTNPVINAPLQGTLKSRESEREAGSPFLAQEKLRQHFLCGAQAL